MPDLNLAILASGSQYNIDAINQCIQSKVLPANIVLVVCNKKCECAQYCKSKKINLITHTRDVKNCSREQYDQELLNKMSSYNVDLVLVFEWTYLFTSIFTKKYDKIIKINSVYSNSLGGSNNIDEIFNALVNSRIKSASSNLELINIDNNRKNIISEVILPYEKSYTKEDFINISKKYVSYKRTHFIP
jgi:folate-dependent phosphoribosylglycinamide formyltransferase PurN